MQSDIDIIWRRSVLTVCVFASIFLVLYFCYTNREDAKYHSEYADFNEKALLRMANGNDMHAYRELGNRIISDDPQKAADYFHQSAILGSLQAISSMAMLSGNYIRRDKDEAFNREQLFKQFVTLKVLAMRGDEHLAALEMQIAKDQYEKLHGKLTLTDEEIQRIAQYAQKTYDELQNERYKLGWGKFANSFPEWLWQWIGLHPLRG